MGMVEDAFGSFADIAQQGAEAVDDFANTPAPAKTAHSTWDYIKDVPLGGIRGVFKGAQGLVDFGFMPVDYLLNTNLTKYIDKAFDYITPETHDTFIGDIAEGLGQFALPTGIAGKILGGMKFLNDVTRIRKLSTISSTLGKTQELLRRTGYYGALTGIGTALGETPSTDSTLAQKYGYVDKADFNELSGRERAEAGIKEKLEAGLEGAAIGGALPAAGDVLSGAYKNIIGPGLVEPGMTALGPVLSTLTKTVIDPAAKVLSGSEILGIKTPEILPAIFRQTDKAISKTSDFLMNKLGLQPIEDWKFNSMDSGFGASVYKMLDTVKNMITTEGPLSTNLALKTQNKKAITITLEDMLLRTTGKLDNAINNFVTQGEFRFKSNLDTIASLNERWGDVKNYLQAEGPEAEKFFNLIDDTAKPYAKELKELKTNMNLEWANYIRKVGGTSYEPIANMIEQQADSFVKQRFSAFNNPNYQYDPMIEKKAVEFMKTRILDNEKLLGEVIEKAGTADTNSNVFQKSLDEFAENRMRNLKLELIKSNKTPQYYFNSIANKFDYDLKQGTLEPGETFDSAIRNLFDAPQYATDGKGNFLYKTVDEEGKQIVKAAPLSELEKLGQLGNRIETTDYKSSLFDTIMHESLTMRNRQYFDDFLKDGLENNLIFKSREDAISKLVDKWTKANPNATAQEIEAIKDRAAKFSQTLQQIKTKSLTKDVMGTIIEQSPLFSENYFATSEIQNAIEGSSDAQLNMFSIPLYKILMQAKTLSQVSKTLLSPATQARNFGSSGLYLLANGLIGDKVSVKEAYKAIAKDLFDTATTKGSNIIDETGGYVASKEDQGIINYLNDAKQRGVLTQNIEVGDLKFALEAVKNGSLNFDQFMRSPVIKRLAEIYTGSDNFWKVYADKFYTAALKPAMQYAEERFVNAGGDLNKLTPEDISKLHMEEIKKWYEQVAGTKYEKNNIFTQKEKSVDEAIRDMSAFLVTNTMPTYSKVPSIIKYVRQLPIGNFIAYPSEIIRTSSNIVAYGARELASDNPYIRQMGAKRLMGMATMMYGLEEGFKKVSSYYTGVDQDKMDAYQRNFAPQYQKNSTLIPVTAPDSNGNFKYYNFSYTNPYSIISEPINAIFNAYADGTLKGSSVDKIVMNAFLGTQERPGAFATFFSPFVSESLAAQAVNDVIYRDGKTKDGKFVYYPQDSIGTKLDKSFGNFLDKIEPGAFTSAKYIWQGATNTFTNAGTIKDTGDEITKLLTGIRIEDAKPLNSMPFVLNSFNRDKQNINSKFANVFYAPEVTAENRIAAMRDLFTESYDSQSKLYQTIKDAKTLGVKQNSIDTILQQRFKNTSEVNDITSGIFKAPNYSSSRIQSLMDRLKREDPVAASRIQNQFNTLQNTFDNLKSSFSNKKLGGNIEDLQDQINYKLQPSLSSARNINGPRLDLSNISLPNLGSLFNLPNFTKTSNVAVPNLNTQTNISTPTPTTTPTTVSPQIIASTNPVQGIQNEQARLNAFFPNDKIL